MTGFWRDVIFANPMSIEVTRIRRKFSLRSEHARLWLCLALLAYVSGNYFAWSVAGTQLYYSPFVLIGIQTALFAIGIPIAMYGSIAGERDKRTWDVLIAAPITNEQIVAGKFFGALTVISALHLALLVPTLLLIRDWDRMTWPDLALAWGVSYSFAVLVAAISLFFSARARRGMTALGFTLGSLATVLVGGLYASQTAIHNPQATFAFDLMHPLYSILMITTVDSNRALGNSWEAPAGVWGPPQILAYSLSIPVWLYWAVRTLNFAESDVRVGARRIA